MSVCGYKERARDEAEYTDAPASLTTAYRVRAEKLATGKTRGFPL